MNPVAKPTTKCRLCHSGALVRVLSLGNQHVSDFVTAKGDSPKSPLMLVRCKDCGLVQLKHTFPREALYRHYWYKSGISSTMRSALEDLVVKSSEIANPSPGDYVIDIGCNDGTLLRSYKEPGLRLVGFEPAKNLVDEARKGTHFVFNDFFDSGLFLDRFQGTRAKIITSVAMFYDLNNPNRFVSDIAKCLDENGLWVVQQNYLPMMLENNGFDNIGHEHLAYYSLATMSNLIDRHGLEIFDVETNDVNGGSFRTYIGHRGHFERTTNLEGINRYEAKLFSKRPSIYSTFARSVRKLGLELRKLIAKEVRNGRRVYVYGASTRGNTILQYCGLDHRIIAGATDANPEKWGLRTPGTNIPIVSKEAARKEKPDYFLILPHHFLREIADEERAYLSSGGKFIVPLPKLRIVTAENMAHQD